MRVVTNDDIKKYHRMINMYIRKYVLKNWNEASNVPGKDDIILGNTGLSVADIRQYLYAELVFALQKYDPNYRTADGKSVLESTFVYRHLFNRCGQFMKRLTKKSQGYGVWTSNIEEVLLEYDSE